MKKEVRKLSLKKMQIVKFDNLKFINGGDRTIIDGGGTISDTIEKLDPNLRPSKICSI